MMNVHDYANGPRAAHSRAASSAGGDGLDCRRDYESQYLAKTVGTGQADHNEGALPRTDG